MKTRDGVVAHLVVTLEGAQPFGGLLVEGESIRLRTASSARARSVYKCKESDTTLAYRMAGAAIVEASPDWAVNYFPSRETRSAISLCSCSPTISSLTRFAVQPRPSP